MAAVTLLGTATFDTSNGSKTVTATPAVGDLIVIVTAHSGNTAATAPTDNNSSGTYVQINSTALKNTSADALQMWVRTAAIPAASSTIFTHAPGTTSGGGLAVMKITGMTRFGAVAIRQSAIQSNQAGSTTPTPVLGVAALTANALIGAVFNGTSPATMTPRSSPAWTEATDVGYSTPTTGLEVMSINSGETGTSIAWGSATTVYSSIVAELDTSVPLDEISDSWWAGTGCMSSVGRGIASAALGVSVAIAGSFVHQDEVPTASPSSQGAGSAPNQRAKVETTFQRFWQQDELPTAPPVTIVEDESWSPPVFVVPRLSIPDAWISSDEKAPTVEEQDWTAPVSVAARLSISNPWVDPDENATATVPLVEEQSWVAPVFVAARLSIPDPWVENDPIATQSAAFGAGGAALPNQRARSETTFQRWFTQDDLPVAAPTSIVENEGWTQPSAITGGVWSVPNPWAHPDEVPTLPLALVDTQEWLQPAVVAARVVLPNQWTDGDEIPSVAPVQGASGSGRPNQRARSETTFRRWFHQDEVPTPAVFHPVEEDAPQLGQATDDVNYIVWAESDDGFVPTSSTPIVDEAYWQGPTLVLVRPTIQVWAEADDFPKPTVDESDWAPPPALRWVGLGTPWVGDDDAVFIPPGSGIGASTQNPNTSAGTGTVDIAGTGADTSAPDVSAGTGAVAVTGTGADTQNPNTSAGTAANLVSGTGASTQAPNTSDATGAVNDAPPGIGGSLQAPNVSAAVGTVGIDGTGASTSAPNRSAGSTDRPGDGRSGYSRQVLIDIYSHEWEEARKKREAQRAAEIAAQQPRAPRTYPVKQVVVRKPRTSEVASTPVVTEPLKLAPPAPIVLIDDVIAEALRGINAPVKFNKPDVETQRRRQEEEQIVAFLIRQLSLNELEDDEDV